MEFTKAPGFGERFSFPENVEITINGDTISSVREASVRMVERWEEAVVSEIVKEARLAGYTEVTVLNKEVIFEALRRYLATPRTNADRIRAMSDKELAWWLAERYAKEAVLSLQDKGVTPSVTEIKAVTERLYMIWARWLMAPAEVVDGN
mgnify:CR=1 FL=1